MSCIDPPQRTDPSDTADDRDHWSEVSELLASLYRIVDRLGSTVSRPQVHARRALGRQHRRGDFRTIVPP